MSTNWADEVDGIEVPQTFTDSNGIKTHIEYRINEDGSKVKVTRRTRNKLIHDKVNKAAAARKKWPKFGKERGSRPGPNPATTNVGDNIKLKLSSTGHIVQEVDEKHEAMKQQLQNKKILCRICKGDHFTTRCPYKDSLGMEDAAAVSPAPAEEADADVSDLFNRFGHISRVFLARDRETNACKGFAFVSFTSRDDAQTALEMIDGRGYDNLILRVEWAKSSL
ncbi:translation initiation factor eIF3 subunit g [Dissophora ornata]|nr:translation initiation factor eIF3 subunit g [Dissophora ornata]